MSEAKLKPLPCPFCGGRASLETKRQGKSAIRTPFWRGWVRCMNNQCGVSTPLTRAPEPAVRIWNKRAEQVAESAP